MLKKFNFAPVFAGFACYDGDGTDSAAAAAAAEAALKVPVDEINPEDLEGDKYKSRTFTTEEVNKIMQKRLRKDAAKAEATIAELTEMKKVAGLSEQQRSVLQARIDDLAKDVQTKEQMAKEQLEKTRRESEEKNKVLSSERDHWKALFTESLLSRTLLDASTKEKAFNNDHVIALLRPNAKVVEELGDDQKPTGNFIVKVNQTVVDKDGKKSVLSLSAFDAVKRMKDDPTCGNLFEETLKGGLGLTNQGSQRPVDLANISSPEQYARVREQLKRG